MMRDIKFCSTEMKKLFYDAEIAETEKESIAAFKAACRDIRKSHKLMLLDMDRCYALDAILCERRLDIELMCELSKSSEEDGKHKDRILAAAKLIEHEALQAESKGTERDEAMAFLICIAIIIAAAVIITMGFVLELIAVIVVVSVVITTFRSSIN